MADGNYQRLKAQRIVDRARRLLDQIPFSSETADTDSNMIGGPGTRFSNEEMLELVNAAQHAIAQNVKASHIPNLIKGTSLLVAPTPVLRILPNRVFLSADAGTTYTRAVRRKVDSHRRLEDPGRQASTTYPIYTYEAGELNIYPAGQSYYWFYVTTPTELTALGDTLQVDERFECAMVHYVASLAYQKLQRMDLHDLTNEIYLSELQPYARNTSGSVLKEREVEVE